LIEQREKRAYALFKLWPNSLFVDVGVSRSKQTINDRDNLTRKNPHLAPSVARAFELHATRKQFAERMVHLVERTSGAFAASPVPIAPLSNLPLL
jgi:hypothetical protein